MGVTQEYMKEIKENICYIQDLACRQETYIRMQSMVDKELRNLSETHKQRGPILLELWKKYKLEPAVSARVRNMLNDGSLSLETYGRQQRYKREVFYFMIELV